MSMTVFDRDGSLRGHTETYYRTSARQSAISIQITYIYFPEM